jgi:hypothetical protein
LFSRSSGFVDRRIEQERADWHVIEQAAAPLRHGAIVAGYASLPGKHYAFALALLLGELAPHLRDLQPEVRAEALRGCADAAGRDHVIVRRVLDDPTAIGLWLALTLAGSPPRSWPTARPGPWSVGQSAGSPQRSSQPSRRGAATEQRQRLRRAGCQPSGPSVAILARNSVSPACES